MEAEIVSETLEIHSRLTQLIVRVDFIACGKCALQSHGHATVNKSNSQVGQQGPACHLNVHTDMQPVSNTSRRMARHKL